MGLYKRGNIWWVAITVNGKQQCFSTKTSDKKTAEQIYAKLLLKLNNQNSEPVLQKKSEPQHLVKESSITFETYYQNHYLPWCRKRHNSYEIKKYYLNVIPEWFKKLKLNQISTKEVEMLQTYFIDREYSRASCNKYISILKASFAKACEWNMISEQRLKNIRKVKLLKGETKRLRYLNADEIHRLLSCCDKHLYPIVFTALHTGMRKEEILSLKWSQVDLKNDLILLDKTKNDERREIPINKPLKQVLIQLYTQRRLDTDYVFVNPDTGKRYTDLKRSFTTACKRAGIKDFHFHDLRHTYASQLVMNGVDLKTVQELLGHKSLTMTLRYAHLSHAHKKDAVKQLEKLHYYNFTTIYYSQDE